MRVPSVPVVLCYTETSLNVLSSIFCLIISVILKCHVSSSVKRHATLCTAKSGNNSIFCARNVFMRSQQPLSPYRTLTDCSDREFAVTGRQLLRHMC
jgi:hypothetical protein